MAGFDTNEAASSIDPELLKACDRAAEFDYIEANAKATTDLFRDINVAGRLILANHLSGLAAIVKASGGIKRVNSILYGYHRNEIECDNGNLIPASTLVSLPPKIMNVGQIATESAFPISVLERSSVRRLQFSLEGLDTPAHRALDLDHRFVGKFNDIAHHLLQEPESAIELLRGVCTSDTLITTTTDPSTDKKILGSTHFYTVTAHAWHPNLREEFRKNGNFASFSSDIVFSGTALELTLQPAVFEPLDQFDDYYAGESAELSLVMSDAKVPSSDQIPRIKRAFELFGGLMVDYRAAGSSSLSARELSATDLPLLQLR